MPDTQSSEQAAFDTVTNLVIAALLPLFLDAARGDLHLAETAIIETIAAYGIETEDDLFSAGKLIAFNIAALRSVVDSMQPDLSLDMALRLRANGNACNRTAEQCRAKLPAAGKGRTAAPARARTAVKSEVTKSAKTQAAVETDAEASAAADQAMAAAWAKALHDATVANGKPFPPAAA